MGVAHPQRRLIRGRRGREPFRHDRDDGIEAGTGGTSENVLQQCATVQLRDLFRRAESAGFAGRQDDRGEAGRLAR